MGPTAGPVARAAGITVAVFPLLLADSGYRACEIDLLRDEATRAYWLDVFARQIDVHLRAATAAGATEAACRHARVALHGSLADVRDEPGRHGRLDLLVLDALRTEALRGAGITDEFRVIKARENEAALRALPDRLATLDALSGDALVGELVRGQLAGNLFDMGSVATASRYVEGSIPFDEALGRVPDRPWRVDDLDRVATALGGTASPRKVVMFADNAGADVVLGLLPLARHFLRSGAEVIVTANDRPVLNDVTVTELAAIVAHAQAVDGIFDAPELRLVGNGTGTPLVDLSRVGGDLAEAALGADLVVLVGMGRALESNWRARFRCASWRVAIIKDPQVAAHLEAALFDAICRFEPVP